jgi:hypothetical protein
MTSPKARWSIDAPQALDEAVTKRAAELGYSRTRFVLKAVEWALSLREGKTDASHD